jgi:chromosome segregation ATPase
MPLKGDGAFASVSALLQTMHTKFRAKEKIQFNRQAELVAQAELSRPREPIRDAVQELDWLKTKLDRVQRRLHPHFRQKADMVTELEAKIILAQRRIARLEERRRQRPELKRLEKDLGPSMPKFRTMELENGSCTGKVRHTSHHEARDESKRILDRSGEDVRPYHCQFCGFFHVGHPPNSMRREALAKMMERSDGYQLGYTDEPISVLIEGRSVFRKIPREDD